jgi:WD40 repeat protein
VLAAGCADGSLQTWKVVYNPGQPPPADFGKPLQSYRHDGAVTGVAFAPNGIDLYSASLDRSIRAWKLAAEGPIRVFGHPAREVDAVAFSPDGNTLATGGHDGKIRLFDVSKGQLVREISAHVAPAPAAGYIYCLAWSPDGKQVVSGSSDHSLKLWDVAGGKLVREFKAYKEKIFEKGHRDPVFCVTFSPDGKQLVSGGSDHAIKVWSVADGTVVRELVNPALKNGPGLTPQAHPGWVYGVRYTPDGKFLVSSGQAPRLRGFLAVWDAGKGTLLSSAELPVGPLYSLALSPNGRLLALGTGGGVREGGVNAGLVLKMPAVGN